MKKKLTLLFALVVMIVIGANAQVELKGLIGMNLTSFQGSDYDNKAKVGYQFGGGLLIGNKFYVEPTIQFVRNSTLLEESQVDNLDESEFSQNLVKIPVHFGYHLLGSEDESFALRVFAGPSISIPGKIKSGPEGITKDDVNSSIWAVDGGVGFDFLFLFVEASYEHSFNDYFSEDVAVGGKHGGLILNAGVHLDF